MHFERTSIPDVVIIEPKKFGDSAAIYGDIPTISVL